MKNFLKRNVVVVFVITTIWFMNIDNLFAQIDCNGNLTCTLDNNGWQYKTLLLKYDACKLAITLKFATCINGEKIIDILKVEALNIEQLPCVYPTSSYMNEIIRFVLVKNGEIFGIRDFENSTNIIIKTPSCAKWESVPPGPNSDHLDIYSKLVSCNTICCITNYQISNKINGVYVFNNTVIADNTTQGCLPVEGCTSMCSAHFITSADILESDFEDADDCNLSCYWRLDGNDNVTNSNFIGPTNDMPLHLKTNNNLIYLSPNGHPVMTLDGDNKSLVEISGKLLISTSGGTYNLLPTDVRLAVGGKILAEEVIVKLQSNWPDYVFDKDYKLKSLSELHKYILENRKLPGVPSADDMQNIEVGKMIPIMMEKIEELTLYLLEIKKENDELKKKIEKLNKGE